MKIKTPTGEQLSTAVAWLRVNEGEGDEAPDCQAVADWLEFFRDEEFLRTEARRVGVPVARLRRKLAELSKQPKKES